MAVNFGQFLFFNFHLGRILAGISRSHDFRLLLFSLVELYELLIVIPV